MTLLMVLSVLAVIGIVVTAVIEAVARYLDRPAAYDDTSRGGWRE